MSVDQVLATDLELILAVEGPLFLDCSKLEDDVEYLQLFFLFRQLILELMVLFKLMLDYGEVDFLRGALLITDNEKVLSLFTMVWDGTNVMNHTTDIDQVAVVSPYRSIRVSLI